jgi:DNA repair protein RadC
MGESVAGGDGAARAASALHEQPRGERPRERLKALGPQALSAAELLAIVVGTGSGGGSALDVAQRVIGHGSGSLRRLAGQPVAALTRCAASARRGRWRSTRAGAGPSTGARGARGGRPDPLAARRVPTVRAAPPGPSGRGVPRGDLDAQHRLERDVLVTRGILNSSLVHPREVFREAIAERAAAIVLVHNHPSGDPSPARRTGR